MVTSGSAREIDSEKYISMIKVHENTLITRTLSLKKNVRVE